MCVAEELIRLIGGDGDGGRGGEGGGGGSLEEGDAVEARYKGKSRFYPGRISRVRRDGTYDIDYDDGEKEMRVAADLVRRKEGGGGGGGRQKAAVRRYEEFQRVEARFQAGRNWTEGRITRVRDDGNYDIEYNDGSEEYRVMPELI